MHKNLEVKIKIFDVSLNLSFNIILLHAYDKYNLILSISSINPTSKNCFYPDDLQVVYTCNHQCYLITFHRSTPFYKEIERSFDTDMHKNLAVKIQEF